MVVFDIFPLLGSGNILSEFLHGIYFLTKYWKIVNYLLKESFYRWDLAKLWMIHLIFSVVTNQVYYKYIRELWENILNVLSQPWLNLRWTSCAYGSSRPCHFSNQWLFVQGPFILEWRQTWKTRKFSFRSLLKCQKIVKICKEMQHSVCRFNLTLEILILKMHQNLSIIVFIT